nr:DNA-protecting protein DprA [Acrocarpospora pleiomorpha]
MATIIVEASERSGTRIQARKAVEHSLPPMRRREWTIGRSPGEASLP